MNAYCAETHSLYLLTSKT